MPTTPDLWKSYLEGLGYSGSRNDMLRQALSDETGLDTKVGLSQLWYEYLTQAGYTGTRSDMMYAWLGDKGYTGGRSKRIYDALVAGDLFGFDPLSLFANGEQGAWYDPSDLTTLYQDSAGTTPVTNDGDPVGLILDKSGNDNHASQSTTASKPVYRTDGTLHWLEFDGVDDYMDSAAYGRPTSVAIAAAIDKSSESAPIGFTDWSLWYSFATYLGGLLCYKALPLATNVYPGGIGSAFVGSTDLISSGAPNIWLNNTFAANQTLYDQKPAQDTGIRLGARNEAGSITWFLQGTFFGCVVRDEVISSSERESATAYLAKKAGVTL